MCKVNEKIANLLILNAKKPNNVAKPPLLTNINAINPHNFKKTPYLCTDHFGVVLEWMKRHAWKACIRQKRIGGSNPPHSATKRLSNKFRRPFFRRCLNVLFYSAAIN